MKKIIFLILITHCTLSIENCYSQWVQQNSGVTSPLYNVQFINRYTGWITGGNNVILKTSNGGVNWIQQFTALPGSRILKGISMLNEQLGYIVGYWRAILKTTDGGDNWVILRVANQPIGNSYTSCSFINPNTGWLCGFLGDVQRTTNGGLTWDSLPMVTTTGPLNDIQFLNENIGYVCGDVGFIVRTTNGGNNWITGFLSTTSNTTSISFINTTTGWASAEQNNQIFRTTNGGINWTLQAVLPDGLNTFCVFFSSFNTGWAGCQSNRVFKSTNSGFNWVRENVYPQGFVSNFYFYNDSVGWAACGSGKIIHTSNSGEPLGLKKIENEVPITDKLFNNYPNPFNGSTTFVFSIKEKSFAKIILYDILGKQVDLAINNFVNQGSYEMLYNAIQLSSGVYFYTLYVNDLKIQTNKFILNK